MYKIRKLGCNDLDRFWDIVVMAESNGYYPNQKKDRMKWFEKIFNECEDLSYYGAFDANEMRGCLAVSTGKVNIRQSILPLAGIGMVNTDLLHKKEKVCKTLMEYSMKINAYRNINMLFLSPFRPDFYKNMGFGYGSSVYRYKLKPEWFKYKGNKSNLTYLNDDILDEYERIHTEAFSMTHGEINRIDFFTPYSIQGGKRVLLRYDQSNKITGSMVFSFGDENSLVINELIYVDSNTLDDFCSFLYSQVDQIDWVKIDTTDEYLYYLLERISNSPNSLDISACSVDNMFRIINVEGIFKQMINTNFNNQNILLKIGIIDDFFKDNNKDCYIKFTEGYPEVLTSKEDYDVAIELHISDFTSLFMGAINASSLERLGLLKVSNKKYLQILDILFMTSNKPQCTVHI